MTIKEEKRDLFTMPKIACGRDRKKWSDVKPLIEKVFGDTDIEIVVCSL